MASVSLFRQQAIEAKANTLIGESMLASPLRFKIITALVLTTVLAFLCIVIFGSYTKKQTVRGYVTTTEANVRVFPSRAGVISEFFFTDGDEVTKGQALAKISTSISTSVTAAHSVQAELLDSMQLEADGLQEQIARALEFADAEASGLRHSIDNALFQIGVLKEQVTVVTEALQLAQKNVARMRSLHSKQLIAEVDVDSARAGLLERKLNLTALQRELATQRALLEQHERDLLQMPARTAEKTAVLDADLRRVRQKFATTKGQEAIVVIAPADGTVSDLGRRVGQRIGVDVPLLSLLPASLRYNVELFVPSRSIGSVSEGDEIRLRYDAYPYQKYGVFSATILRVATTPTRPGEADAPIQLREPGYRLVASLDNQVLIANGEALSLQAGMTLHADIGRQQRRIIEWMFEPIAGVLQRSQ